jgi:nitroreductase
MNDTINAQQILQQLKWRYATKQFDPARQISEADWAALQEAAVLSPSSYGLQPYQLLEVRDPALRQRLLPAAHNQSQIVDASHLVVFAVKSKLDEASIDEFLRRISQVRQTPVEQLAGYRGMMMGTLFQGMDAAARLAWARCQAYIALGNLLTCAALLRIDACPMEGFDRRQFDEILGLPEKGLAATVLAPLGYRAADDRYALAPKVRFPKEQVWVRF